MMVNAFTTNVSWESYLKNYLELKNITKEDIVSVSNKYYGSNYLALYSPDGKPETDKLNKPAFEAVIPEDGKVSIFAQTWRQTETPALQAKFVDFQKDIQTEKLADLVTLKMVNNPYNQIFNLDFSWGMGTDHNALLFYLPSYLNKLGTNTKNATEFKKALFEVGASMNFYATDNAFRSVLKELIPGMTKRSPW